MRAGMYARVSSKRQAQDQTIEQQLARGRTAIEVHGGEVSEAPIYRDDGYSGARLSRPGLDRLRDDVALAEVEVVVITAPDRLARKYLHQVLLVEEFERHGVRVEFVERPMSQDPHDQLLLQIRGAVAPWPSTSARSSPSGCAGASWPSCARDNCWATGALDAGPLRLPGGSRAAA